MRGGIHLHERAQRTVLIAETPCLSSPSSPLLPPLPAQGKHPIGLKQKIKLECGMKGRNQKRFRVRTRRGRVEPPTHPPCEQEEGGSAISANTVTAAAYTSAFCPAAGKERRKKGRKVPTGTASQEIATKRLTQPPPTTTKMTNVS